MREAIRYLTPQKLDIFTKIPFLLHINVEGYPGYVDTRVPAHGIWNFQESGFFKEIVKTTAFPKSIIENTDVEDPCVLGFYHIGSLGTFTQSTGSDFDFWVIIDRKKFSKERYENLEKKLDGILKHCREKYDQEVTFFIMDKKDIRLNLYAAFDGQETLSAPKVFLKEEFYRTFLMIAGKIPVWAILPDSSVDDSMNMQAVQTQLLAMHEDLIDLGSVDTLPVEDVLKGLLWHICKSKEDPVKALIKATMVFSYGFGEKISRTLLCEKIKLNYSKAEIDEFVTDPYKALFDRILEFHQLEDHNGLNLIKNAIFFRLCEYPNIKMPDENTPKRSLLNTYIKSWKLNKTQVGKLLAYTTWSESEKRLLEKTIITRLAQMYNHALKSVKNVNQIFEQTSEKNNWKILRNKTRQRLRKTPYKIEQCSTYICRLDIISFDIVETPNLWKLNLHTQSGQKLKVIYKHPDFSAVLGWILANHLYSRQSAFIKLISKQSLYESFDQPIDIDRLYMAFAPINPLSETCYLEDAKWSKMMVFLFFDADVVDQNSLVKAQLLVSNTWGEMYSDALEFAVKDRRNARCDALVQLMSKYTSDGLRLFFYQFSSSHDPDIVYQIKKAYNDLTEQGTAQLSKIKKPYLDKL